MCSQPFDVRVEARLMRVEPEDVLTMRRDVVRPAFERGVLRLECRVFGDQSGAFRLQILGHTQV